MTTPTTNTLSSVANPGNFLRTTRHFPADMQELTVELNKTYTETATQLNNRISGIYGTNTTITGEAWYLKGESGRQQTLRKVFVFNSPIPIAGYAHGINPVSIYQFTKCTGEYTNSSGDWFGCIFGSNVSIAGQVSFYITPTHVVILQGAGAPKQPNGIIILEWLSVI